MKKILAVILFLAVISPMSWAGNWGAGVKLGYGQNDPKAMKDTFNNAYMYNRELKKSGGIFAIEVFHEWEYQYPENKIGLKLGLDAYGENELTLHGLGTATEETYAVPLTLYYKWDKGVQEWSYFAGAGVTYIDTEVDHTSDSKLFPHLTAGAEYRFSPLFALGVDVKYNISAKLKKDGLILSDRSGLSATLAARFYL